MRLPQDRIRSELDEIDANFRGLDAENARLREALKAIGFESSDEWAQTTAREALRLGDSQ
jgi:hypothetical protein